MSRQRQKNLYLPGGNPDDEAWEIFHENSKLSEYDRFLPDELMAVYLNQLSESLSFDTCTEVPLPTTRTGFQLSLEEAMTRRETTRNLTPSTLSIEDLATLLHYAYGITRDNKETVFQRGFRVVPSADAFYPLEIFFHALHIEGLSTGLYHFNPTRNSVSVLRGSDHSGLIARGLTQKHLAISASLIVFITAMFERTILKYGNRGYRFVLLEAGHVAQNINLAATGLNLACVNIGGYFDAHIDSVLGIDGLTHSTVYMVAIGEKGDDAQSGGEESDM
jgi:SagB-type dehydrogenase family enzyme